MPTNSPSVLDGLIQGKWPKVMQRADSDETAISISWNLSSKRLDVVASIQFVTTNPDAQEREDRVILACRIFSSHMHMH